MEIINNNPYRILGVYSTSSQREVVANQGKMKAFLKVGRQVSFPLDLNEVLPDILRSEENVADAISKLSLPAEQLKYAQFWFSKCTQIDEIACGKLTNGDIDGAIEIWNKKATASSLQNLLVCSLIRNQLGNAISYAQTLYSSYSHEFVKMVSGENALVTSENLAHDFLNAICDEYKPSQFLEYITNAEWKEYVGNKSTKPIIDKLISAIDACKSSKGKGPTARLNAGTKLMNDTKTDLTQLRGFVSSNDLQYQMIADKLGLEILQCGIDYYNDSDAADAAHKAMVLQKYAQSIVVGKMAKDRCNENIRILEDIISKLPPLEVQVNHKAIQSYLTIFALQPDLISCSIQLIKDCVPHIVEIKEKLGNTNQYYLRISTSIVNSALGNIIAEVNEAQKSDFDTLKTALISAWRTQLYMDKFDLDPEYKEGRYKECREALHGIISQCKGFDDSSLSFMYQYGCGWCNDLDVSDLDLRTEKEFYQSCNDLTSYISYLKKYPSGKYVSQAKMKIVDLRFKECKTIADFQKFISDFPNSNYITEAQAEMNKLIREENERKMKIAQQEKALSVCKTADEVIALYESEKVNKIAPDKCSLKAYQLAKSEDDYRNVISTFGTRSTGGQKAKEKINEIERINKEKAEARRKVLKWTLWISIPLLIILVVSIIWGVQGLAAGCGIIAMLSGTLALGAIAHIMEEDGCLTSIILVVITIIFGFLAVGLGEWAGNIEKENKSKKLYEQIINNPSEESCRKYIQQFNTTDNANKVRDIWLSLLLNEANDFDYDSFEGTSVFSNSSSTNNPIKKLQEFISQNDRREYRIKAEAAIESICDSLYGIADKKSTASGWKQYQRLVPTDYFKDSEEKIEKIENLAWNTEPKAWQMALSENSISSFTKYKSLYPKGSHIALCEKKLIDLEVSRIYAGDHGTLPEMERIGYGSGATSYITVSNRTSYTLTLLYSGSDSKRLVIPAGGTSSIRLKNGNYRVAASVSASNVRNYAGNENLQGGNYSAEYYISTTRF